MANDEQQLPANEFHSRLTSPKLAEEVGTEMHNHNGGMLAFKVYPKAWDDGDHHGSTERFEIPSPQIDDDDDVEDHGMSEHGRLQHSINLPPMSPTALSPSPKYIPSQVCSQSVYAYTCTYTQMHTRTYIFIQAHTYTITHIHTYTCICTHNTHIHTHTRIHMHTNMHTNAYICIWYPMYMYVLIIIIS